MIEKLIATAPGTLISLVAILCGTLFLLTWVTWHYWHSSRLQAREIELKRDMLARGLSAGDIERVLWVSADNSPYSEAAQTPESMSDNEYALIEKMLDDGQPVEKIEGLIRALKSGNSPRPERRAEIKPEIKPEDVSLQLT